MQKLGLVLLLVGGLVHLFPGTLTPIVEWGYGVVTIQTIVGLVSVIIALMMLFGGNEKKE